ncbi:hypothetical protein UFOVP1083_22 [uncultured Caudovirales phage]|uniref:Uncharacterized protein n=1 Tax=uncultured Caudovirales phage TaxID=2100421 RepID=A0A6J5S2P8_9CAUD|nr:hypothetical protein UFOVP1083_22 [uncultured Caudovirales phage]CAB4199314.1 hypothetical protein UFOVP1327_31 [uncultured Caudovirales phage]
MGVNKDDVNISGVSKKNPFANYANSIAMREQQLQTNTSNALNMTSSLQNIANQTGMQGTINPEDIPSVAGLANTQAGVAASSNLRSKNTTEMVKGLPSYVKSYSNYLRWRYPSRYGIKKSTSSNYTTDFQQAGGDLADLADPFAPPGFGK